MLLQSRGPGQLACSGHSHQTLNPGVVHAQATADVRCAPAAVPIAALLRA